jgi:molybdopterin-synthase adenylyltransferase
MYRSDPLILLTRDGASKIAASGLNGGDLPMRAVPAENMFVVDVVETDRGIRSQVVIPRQYVALRWGGPQRAAAQWVRKPDTNLNLEHLLLRRRFGTEISFESFKAKCAEVRDPGAKLGLLITHDPGLGPEALKIGANEFAGWLVRRAGVRPIDVQVEPQVLGTPQLVGRWPIERLALNSVMLVGCGSIGSAATEALAGYGIGRVELLDPDHLLWHNLVRHILGAESVGRFKVSALKDYISDRWPDQDIRAHRMDIVEEAHYARRIIESVDLVLCTADGIAPRRVVSHLARRAGKPAVLACVLDQGAVGEIIRLRPTPRFGCLLCLRHHLARQGAMDAEADQELEYGTGEVHRPMTAVPPDLRYIGTLAAKVSVATLLEALHGDHTQRIPGEHIIIGLNPGGDLKEPFDLRELGTIRWSAIPPPRTTCPTCGAA